MTRLEMLKYAYEGALAKWHAHHERLQAHPNNEITKFREAKYKRDLDEIREEIKKEEQREFDQKYGA